jgi:hypothetical protein
MDWSKITIKQKTLSDGSKVYDVRMVQAIFECYCENDARAFAAGLENLIESYCVNVE